MTEPAADRKLEGHKKMIDIQYEVEGEVEWIGVETIFEAGECIESYPERDLYFYESSPKGESKVYFETGRFAVFFPEDLHRPLCQGESGSRPRKAVVKVPVEWVSVREARDQRWLVDVRKLNEPLLDLKSTLCYYNLYSITSDFYSTAR